MAKTRKFKDSSVSDVFETYPVAKRTRLLELRELIFEVAEKSDDIGLLEETLKWGEPAYLSKKGSTVRLAWQQKNNGYCGLYFNCQTKLVDTIREIYSDQLSYESNRGVFFSESKKLPREIAGHCIELALRYHRIKHLPLLGT